jgi:hypothetical protein
MDDAEIRAEIERRRKRAIDLKIRESVWSLYKSEFKYIDDRMQKDRELILPAVRETYRKIGNAHEFGSDGVQYRLACTEGKKERDRYDGDVTTTTHYTIGLGVNGSQVLEFKARASVTYMPEEPLFDDRVGEITAFIEGEWVTVIPELLEKMRAHSREVRRQRNAPKEAQRLKEDMKRFGLR